MAWISGVWKWNDVAHYEGMKTFSVNFKCNGNEYTGITFDWYIGYSYLYYLPWGTQAGESLAENDQNVYMRDECRLIDFGADEQYVDEEFYEYLTANARPYGDLVADMVEIIAENEQKVYDAGKQAEYDAFWDKYQENGTRTDYQYGGFGGRGWNDESYKPKYTPKPVHAYSMFQGCLITEITNVDWTNTNSIEGCFAYSGKLKYIGAINANNLAYCNNAFRLCSKLETIELLKLNENTKINTQTFDSLPELQNVTIEGNISGSITLGQSTKLTKDSITSIINALWSGASGKTLTLSRTAVDEAFKWYGGYRDDNGEWVTSEYLGTEEGSGNEWYPLEATKPNWTITLV